MEPIKSNGTQHTKAALPKVVKKLKAKAKTANETRSIRATPKTLAEARKVMNKKELAVIAVIVKAGDAGIRLEDIAGKAFTKKGTAANTKGNSWVRNSIRRPLRWGFIKKADRGTYVVTASGKSN